MKKLKLCLFVLIVVSGLFYFLNLYSVNPQTNLILKDVLPNDAIRSQLNFSFTQEFANLESTAWQVTAGELKVSKPMNQQEAFYKQNPFYPYSNIVHPYSISGFEDFTTSKVLSVNFKIRLDEAAANTQRIYAYPKIIKGQLFKEIAIDLTVPIPEKQFVCIADIKAGQAIPETFEDCSVSPEFAGVINTLQDDISIIHATINQTRYWSLSKTKGMTGENHLYQSSVGRFDQPTILASWDNREKQVLSLVTTPDRILLICEDRIDEYDVQGTLINSYAYQALTDTVVTQWTENQLLLSYYNQFDELQTVQSFDLPTQTLYTYELGAYAKENWNNFFAYKNGCVYLLRNNVDSIQIEVYDGYEKIYEGVIEGQTFNNKGMTFAHCEWR